MPILASTPASVSADLTWWESFVAGEPWMKDGACRDPEVDPDVFFPSPANKGTVAPKRICVGCGVRNQCLAYALQHDESFGVWGGLSELERREISSGVSTYQQPFDDAVVVRVVRGERLRMSPGERREVIRRLHAMRMSDGEIARHVGMQARSVFRIRTEMRLPANFEPGRPKAGTR